GAEVQSGLLGWLSLLRGVRPQFPPMPERGTFRLIRHPIYLAFALVTWTVPVRTPDALLAALVLTAYCALGPLLKERRFDAMFGDRWRAYRARTPFWIPRLRR
ncbi:MAG: isoprenylcysteine carboxylmethyltransferase family protein, partial [Pseudomonadota bacterium]